MQRDLISVQQLDKSEPGTLARWMPVIACLLAAGFAAAVACPVPASGRLNPVELVFWTLGYVLLLFGIATATGWVVFVAVRPPVGLDITAVVLRFAAAAVFFAPVAIFIAAGYFWSVAAAGAFAVMMAKLLRRFERATVKPFVTEPEEAPPPRCMFQGEDSGAPLAHRLRILCAAVSAQAGVIAAATDFTAAAVFFFGSSCFLVAWWATASDVVRRQSVVFRRSNTFVLESILPAIILTLCALMPYVSSANPRAATGDTPPVHQESHANAGNDLYSGIILLPEVQRHVTIVPPVPIMRRRLFRPGARNPLSFPFSGEYWFFYWPRRSPPKNSIVARGTPTEFKFTATGKTPLTMQARQSFGTPVDVQCCSRVDLAISNTDPMPGTVGVEVILVNRALTEKSAQSLGEVNLASTLPAGLKGVADRETLKFDVPDHPIIREFDELRVVFHLREPRINRSANIAIERFYLVPRGL